MNAELLSINHLASLLEVNPYTVRDLVKNRGLPCVAVGKSAVRFSFSAVKSWLAGINVQVGLGVVAELTAEYPLALAQVRSIDRAVPRNRAACGYNLLKRVSKTNGFVYYVRYYHKGKMLPSKWCCHTNRIEEARLFAIANRERIVSMYLARHDADCGIYKVMSTYYAPDSEILRLERLRGRSMCEMNRKHAHAHINHYFIPYLRDKKVNCAEDVTLEMLVEYQNMLLLKGNKPKTINKTFCALSYVFAYLTLKKQIKHNPFRDLEPLKMPLATIGERDCYDVDKLRGGV